MPYTTTQRIKEILQTSPEGYTNVNLTWVVRMAEQLTSSIVAYRVARGLPTATDEHLGNIADLLGCHFYQQSDKGHTRRRTGQREAYFQIQVGKGLDSTLYGQSAKLLDDSGYLDGLGKSKFDVITDWLGLPPSQQTPYINRD